MTYRDRDSFLKLVLILLVGTTALSTWFVFTIIYSMYMQIFA